MITPGNTVFTGWVGSTFDTSITVYPQADAQYSWYGPWVSGVNFSIGQAVIGSDVQAYVALKANTSINPIGDGTGSWSTPLVPMNLNGWSGTIEVAPVSPDELFPVKGTLLVTPVTIQGLQGKISIKFQAQQSTPFAPGTYHHWITMTNTATGDVYYFLNGNFIWNSP